MMQKRIVRFTIFIWVSVVLGMSVSAMLLTGGDLDRFYNEGEVYEVIMDEFRGAGGTVVFDGKKNVYLIPTAEAVKYVNAIKKMKAYHYLMMEISYMNRDSMDWIIEYYDFEDPEQQVLIRTENIVISEGINIIPVSADLKRLVIKIYNQENTEFSIKKIQFRERLPVWDRKKFIGIAFLFSVLFIIFSEFLYRKKLNNKKANAYTWIMKLQLIYFKIAEICWITQNNFIKRRKKEFRIVLMDLMMVSLLTIYNMKGYLKSSYPIFCSVGFIGLAAIAWCSVEERKKIQNWDNGVFKTYFGMALLICISDFIVPKTEYGIGVAMITVFGFLLFVWSNMENPYQLVVDFFYAVIILFTGNVIFCYLFRPLIEGIRYTGITTNPGIYAFYNILFLIVLLAGLERCLFKGKWNFKFFIYIIGIITCEYFLWKTQSLTGIICNVFILATFLFGIWKKRKAYSKKVVIMSGLCLALLSFPFVKWNDWALKNLPKTVGNPSAFHNDVYEIERIVFFDALEVKAATAEPESSGLWNAIENSRIGFKLRNITNIQLFTSGRGLIFKSYLKRMNLWGHDSVARVQGTNKRAHNLFLAIGHRYGIIVLIIYVILLFQFISIAFKNFMRGKGACGITVFLLLSSSIIIGLADNIEVPFLWPLWYLIYLGPGVKILQMSNYLLDKEKN